MAGDEGGGLFWPALIVGAVGLGYVYRNEIGLAPQYDAIEAWIREKLGIGGGGNGGCTKTCTGATHLDSATCQCVPNSCTTTCTLPKVLNATTCKCETPAVCNITCTPPKVKNSATCKCETPGGGNSGGNVNSFVAGGDWGNRPDAKTTANAMVGLHPGLFVGLGDYGYDKLTGFQPVVDIINKAGIPMVGTQGNHDTGDSKNFLKVFKENGGQWLFTKNYGANLSIISLNSENSSATKSQAEALLKAATGKFKVVIFHKPIYTEKSKHKPDEGGIKSVVPLFAKYKVNLVLAGHNHHYEHYKACSGVTYCIFGRAGQDAYPCGGALANPCGAGPTKCDTGVGFLHADVSGATMQCKYYSGGSVKDSFTA